MDINEWYIPNWRKKKMHKFKVGDIVEILDKNGSLLKLGRQYSVCRITACGNVEIHTQDSTWVFEDSHLELIQDNKEQDMPDTEKKYKITTELTLQQVADLKRALALAYGFKCLYNELHSIHKEAQRKVVKVGDKEYYEDELSAALANIKSIGE